MLHLVRAVEQLNIAMEYADGGGQSPPKGDFCIRPLTVGAHLRRLEENAVEKGEAGLVISLAKPFQRLLKYHLLFQNLLFRTRLVAFKYEVVLMMVTEVEMIVGGIENKRIPMEERGKVWDILTRIDGLDKIKQLAVPDPSRILVKEWKISTVPSSSGVAREEGRRASNVIGGERDLWLVVFDNVVLRCQRTGTVLLPGWGASRTTNSTPVTLGTAKVAATVRRQPRSRLRNLYKLLEARPTTQSSL